MSSRLFFVNDEETNKVRLSVKHKTYYLNDTFLQTSLWHSFLFNILTFFSSISNSLKFDIKRISIMNKTLALEFDYDSVDDYLNQNEIFLTEYTYN